MGALNTFMSVLQEREAQGIHDAEGALPTSQEAGRGVEYGAANQRKLFGRDAQGAALSFAPALDQYLKAHLFGDIFGRDNLDWKIRELATIAMLAAMEGTENELKVHIAHGKYNGLTDAQVNEIVTLVRAAEWMPEPSKTFQADLAITVRKVFYKNRYDITLCADVYLPKDMDSTRQYAALIVGHPFGAVKKNSAADSMRRRWRNGGSWRWLSMRPIRERAAARLAIRYRPMSWLKISVPRWIGWAYSRLSIGNVSV